MAFTPTNYLTARQAVAEIVAEATGHQRLIETSLERLTRAHARLDAMATDWAPAVQVIDQMATDNPADTGIQALKAELDQVVADVQAMRTEAQTVRDAATGARPGRPA